jgi:helix-turn-helix protein
MPEPPVIKQAFRFALDPTAAQEEFLTACCGASRFWFNQGLALVKERLDRRAAGDSVDVPWSYKGLCVAFRGDTVKDELAPWRDEVVTGSYQAGLEALGKALQKFSDARRTGRCERGPEPRAHGGPSRAGGGLRGPHRAVHANCARRAGQSRPPGRAPPREARRPLGVIPAPRGAGVALSLITPQSDGRTGGRWPFNRQDAAAGGRHGPPRPRRRARPPAGRRPATWPGPAAGRRPRRARRSREPAVLGARRPP